MLLIVRSEYMLLIKPVMERIFGVGKSEYEISSPSLIVNINTA
jgi:hypothetical protein